MKNIYKISYVDGLYFVISELPVKDIQAYAQLHLDRLEWLYGEKRIAHVEPSSLPEITGIRYGSQPVYGVKKERNNRIDILRLCDTA